METIAPNPTKIATKWALIYVVVSIVITYTFQYLDIAESPVKYVAYIPFIAFCFLAQKEFKDQLGGFITFGKAFNTGFRYALFSGLLLGIFIYIYLQFLSPEMLTKSMEQQEAKMAEKGLSQEQIDKAIEMGKKLGPMLGAVATAISSLIFGSIVSLVGAAILKREPSVYDIPDESRADQTV
ncbi:MULTISPECIES: DUF4199 domain-containing protein [unclassified Mucilaginibacter]|uniref:DUF4199 domain-containing protein n=1 Tax=unclassified Mucilaginibacter TaxID=2617802 RepID=UPI0009692903|nr:MULTISPECIES: DUF4199 domain-containing protein [unclassified Mucilaginibacter]OJW18310.1 MAG: hypothetical protein BGO48_17320 [Mucilaginibacter sp. 44-25]PLW88443.1 MAG: hypothetical protein C0154_16630 [Mucilaginibacter sp.]HEK20937.1 DUF4199 domain-containing protein [Bacteroidota bacterium]